MSFLVLLIWALIGAGGGLLALPFVLPYIISTVPLLALAFCGFLLIVAGAILVTRWVVGGLACLVERTGPIASLGRSTRLTKGCRWKIFGVVLLTIIVSAGSGAIVRFVMDLTGIAFADVIGELLMRAGVSAFSVCIVVMIYHDLRAAKEGISSKEIAAVFD